MSSFALESNLLQRLSDVETELDKTKQDAKHSRRFQQSICNGEIINAAYILFGHSSTSKITKSERYRRLRNNFPLTFAVARQHMPDLDKTTFDRMLNVVDPAHENPWISARNLTAHKITVNEARQSAREAGEQGDCLLRWVELIAGVDGKDDQSLDEMAFKKRVDVETEHLTTPISDLPSLLTMLKTCDPEHLQTLGRFLGHVIKEARNDGLDSMELPCFDFEEV